MENKSITGIDFLTNATCSLFGINTHEKHTQYCEIRTMFDSIKKRTSLEGLANEELCKQIEIQFEENLCSKSVIALLSEKILSILENHIKEKSIHHEDAHQMIWEMLYEHRKISVGDFV